MFGLAGLGLLPPAGAEAQQDSLPGKAAPSGLHQDSVLDDAPGQKDMSDVLRPLFAGKKKDSLRKTEPDPKYHFSIVPAVGYTLSSGFAGILASNVAFYTADPANTNVSNVAVQVVYSQYSQLTIPILLNYWTRDNQWNFIADWRFYKYPQDTYGLGGNSSESNENLIDYDHIRIHSAVMKKVSHNFYVGGGYFLDYHWNIEEAGQENGQPSDAFKYGLPSKTISSGLVANFLFDNRKNSINPAQGLYANVQYRANLQMLGSNSNWQSVLVDVRKYIHFPDTKNILAFWSYNWLTVSGKPPYLDLPATGWDTYNNTGRGYVQARFRSDNMLYLESEFRFGITKNGLLGGVAFANVQSFSDYPSDGFSRLWPAAGAGLRLKINKHSATNIAIDYGVGLNGSKGFFVNLGEVF